jgi:hypothetical protein
MVVVAEDMLPLCGLGPSWCVLFMRQEEEEGKRPCSRCVESIVYGIGDRSSELLCDGEWGQLK